MVDAREILGVDSLECQLNKQPKIKRLSEGTFKKPGGMHRELYALLQSDYRDPPTLAPTDTGFSYKQPKAKIGRSVVRQWRWTSFLNPARSDNLMLYHWRRKQEDGKEYPFAKFGKLNNQVSYSDEEYELYLQSESDGWTREELDHLFELSRQFDRRFVIMFDRYDIDKYPDRCMEDLKQKYYNVVQKLIKVRTLPGQEPKDLPPNFDGEHEKNRKEQLIQIFNRTPEQVEEEEMLVSELKKIESRKKDRERKSQEVTKLIHAVDAKPGQMLEQQHLLKLNGSDIQSNKKLGKKKKRLENDLKAINKDQSGVKFPDIKGSGVFLRSSKLKMPPSIGNKKSKAVEQLLEELGVDIIPMPTEEICQSFNELRNQLLLLYELKQAMGNCEYELQSMKHRYEILYPGKKAADLVGMSLEPPPETPEDTRSAGCNQLLIDSLVPLSAVSARKRRAASSLLESNPWKKLKNI
ncbi:DNA methyltransferase 1-associated protein 1 isoform X1 [Hydra vulgaris]|uniref:DNA methyltransferase 1-associated protein 1 isoform X1 n=1 Tax=Hydra vulgaris TaxID=6087 RepID=UPI0002B48415|nr:DNA methyltransferase 1-associated protein 1 [Hydra vulgaris]